ncbi:MAG: methylated-DNA--[protein]-cysteine S-methyltransferase [Candidatus Velthaea sp.]|jgi:O-6-methylguanine DNA methyltransferase
MFDPQAPRQLGAEFTTAIFHRIGVDRYSIGESTLGPVYLGWSARGVSAVRLAGSAEAEAMFTRWYEERMGRRIVRAIETDAIARAAQAKLRDPSADDVPLDLEAATPFERAVLANVAQIPAGYARPYELLARELDESCAAESVAAVLAHNAVPLLVPCHRVIPEDRCCSAEYVFGAPAQQQLLATEGLDPAAVERVIQRGYRYIESDGWFCLPTCGDIASRLDEPGYVGLRSLAEARARGLRACESCRPVAA